LQGDLEIHEKLNKWFEENPLYFFTPTGSQDDCIKEIALGNNFITIFSAANGTGKTTLLANVLGACIFGCSDNPYFNYPFFNNYPFIKSARIISTPKEVEEIGTIQKEIKRWWPKDKYASYKKGKQYESEFIAGEWIIDCLTYEQDVTQFEGANLSLILFNEPPPLKILYASIARLRRGGKIIIFMTPLDTGGEIIEDLAEKESVIIDGEEIGKVGIVYADIESACIEHGIRGYLEHKNIVQMINFYDPEERDARAKGKPVHLTGRIYPEFIAEEPHVVGDFLIPDDWARINILDPHDAIPFAITWAAIDKTGQIWVYGEFPFEDLEKIQSTNLTIPDYARVIRELEGRNKMKLRLIDPYYGNQRYSNTGKTIKQELGDFGLDYEDGDTSGIDLGHKKVREYLRYAKDKPVSALNHSRLHVFKSCRNHWRSLLRYKRKLLKSGEVKDRLMIDETYKHFCDNLRHLLMRPDISLLNKDVEDYHVGHRIVGDLKDVHFDNDDTEDNYGQYKYRTKVPELV
jgi:phage terminase large subunit-like protein